MKNQLIIVIGAYGSGKSEYSINLSRQLRESEKKVTLVDLDVVNPYFRSRDVREKFAKEGIDVIAPEGEYKHADLPMLSPRIMGAVEDLSSNVILDVGGDPNGCRTLARYLFSIKKRGYDMRFVVNTRRPFTSNPDDIIDMQKTLEATSQLKVSEIICNTNLMEHTTEEIVREGVEIVETAAQRTKKKFEKYLVLENYAEQIPENIGKKQKVVLQYFLNKPWELSNKVHIKGMI